MMTKRVRNALLKIRDGIETMFFGATELEELVDDLELTTEDEIDEVLGEYKFVFDAITTCDFDTIMESEFGEKITEGCNNWLDNHFDEEEA